MNNPVKGLMIAAFSAVVLAGCATQPGFSHGQINRHVLRGEEVPVQLATQGSTGKLLVLTRNRGCKSAPHNGCMLFEKDSVALIKFFMSGSEIENKDCSDKSTTAVITGIQLTTTGSGEKGDFTVLPEAWLRDEAFLALDLTNGYVFKVDKSLATTQVSLLNANFNDAANPPKSFWYQVTAESCDDDKGPWVTDPRGDNMGTTR